MAIKPQKNTNEEAHLLNVKKAAAFLGVSTSTIRQWAVAKKLEGLKVGTRGDWRFTKEELSKMLWGEERAERPLVAAASDSVRAEEALRQAKNRTQLALDAADMGTFVWYPQEDRTEHDQRIFTLMGIADGNPITLREALATMIHPDDRELYASAVADAVDLHGDHKLDIDYRVIHQDGSVHWLHIFGQTFFSNENPPRCVRMNGTLFDTTGRKQTEEKLREIETKQAYLMKLSDAIKELINPEEIQLTACRILGEQVQASRVLYVDVIDEEQLIVKNNYVDGVSPIIATFSAEQFGRSTVDAFKRNEKVIISDVKKDDRYNKVDKQSFLSLDIVANAGMGLLKGGIWVAALGMHYNAPRKWTAMDIWFMEETAERTWAAVERAKAEQALRTSEEKYRTLFTSIDQGFALCELIRNKEGKGIDYYVLEVNPTYEKHTGIRMEMVVGKTILEAFPTMDTWWVEIYVAVVDDQRPAVFEKCFENTGRWFEIQAYPGEKDKFTVLFSDISERKLREANLAFLSDVSADLVGLTNIDEAMNALGAKIATHFKASMCSFLEIDAERGIGTVTHEWRAKDVISLIGEYKIADYGTEVQLAAWRSGKPFVVKDVMTDKRINGEAVAKYGIAAYLNIPIARDGEWRYLLTIYDRVARDWREDEIELMRELTNRIWTRLERARAEQELQKSEERLRHATEASGIYWWEFNFKTNIAFYSSNTEKVIGAPPGKTAEENLLLLHPEDRELTTQAFEEAINGTADFDYMVRSIAIPSSIRWLHVSGKIIFDNQNNPECAIGISQDITERKQIEEDLERAAVQKDEFIAVAAHELKTPVTSVKMYTQVLEHRLRKAGETAAADMVQKITTQIDKLNNLVCDLLDVAKIESGKLEFRKEHFDINILIQQIVEDMQLTAEKHTIRHELKGKKLVFVDRDRLGQVLVNLLSNAIKYSSHKNEILIRSRLEKGNVVISVSDRGSGIPKEQQQKIFERFYRVPGQSKETYPGLGLGLFISSEIIKRHNGRIWLQSAKNKGSTFYISLPASNKKPV